MRIFKEFKEFAGTGNFLDLAIGVVLGGTAGKIVTALVENVLMPPLAFLIGRKDVTELFFSLDGKSYATLAKAKEMSAPVIGYGSLIQSLVDFIIIAFVLFLIVKGLNNMKKKQLEKVKQEEPLTQELLLIEIRDLLSKK